MEETKNSASFRDPSGFVFTRDGVLYRQINPVYKKQYNHLMTSGLYEDLLKQRLIIPHKEVTLSETNADTIIIQPKKVPFISYPYEWCFGQYKDAALATLKIHLTALKYNMVLKDATAYNIQFVNNYALLIDTLSFEFYEEGKPWNAYGQFCRHFLAPILLMNKIDLRLSKMMEVFIDGIPLDLAAGILRKKGGFLGSAHINMHAKAIARHDIDGHSADKTAVKAGQMSKTAFHALADGLFRSITKIKDKEVSTEWGNYYEHTNYNAAAKDGKEKLVNNFLLKCGNLQNVWDLGANDGRYSRLALKTAENVVSFDIDPVAVGKNYQIAKHDHEKLLPLILDLTTPSPAIGFANMERLTVTGRQYPDCIMMLAVIHHMAISNNLPFDMIAKWISKATVYLIIEFVPKEDSQVKILLASREDIFPDYNKEGFEKIFGEYFTIEVKENIPDSERTLYLMKSKL